MNPSTSATYEVKKRVFDLEKFEKVTLKGTYTFEPVTSTQEFLSRINNDQVKFLALANEALKRDTMKQAKAALSAENAGSSKVISSFVATFRLMPQFKDLAKGEQVKAIYAFIKATPALFEGIKAASLAALATEDEDEETEETEEQES